MMTTYHVTVHTTSLAQSLRKSCKFLIVGFYFVFIRNPNQLRYPPLGGNASRIIRDIEILTFDRVYVYDYNVYLHLSNKSGCMSNKNKVKLI